MKVEGTTIFCNSVSLDGVLQCPEFEMACQLQPWATLFDLVKILSWVSEANGTNASLCCAPAGAVKGCQNGWNTAAHTLSSPSPELKLK